MVKMTSSCESGTGNDCAATVHSQSTGCCGTEACCSARNWAAPLDFGRGRAAAAAAGGGGGGGGGGAASAVAEADRCGGALVPA